MRISILFALTVLFVIAPAAAQQPPRRLVLDEVRHQELPRGFEAVGASIAPDGAVLLWAFNQPYLLLVHGSGAADTIRNDGIGLPVAASFLDGSSIEVVDGRHRTITRISRSGAVLTTSRISTAIPLHTGVRSSEGWFVGGRDGEGVYHLLSVGSDGSTSPIYRIKTRGATASTPALPLSVRGSDVLLTTVQAPFTVLQVDRSGKARSVHEPRLPDSLMADGSAPFTQSWISLRALELDDGMIQTISHLASDRRIFVTYGAPEAPPNHATIEVPLGFVATDPRTSKLIALRRVGSLEMVEYRWRWAEPKPD